MATATVFTPSDLAAILGACRDLRGETFANGVDRGRWLESFVRVAWETGLRHGDLLNLHWGSIDRDDMLRVVQFKDGAEFSCRLSRETIVAMRCVSRPPRDRLVFTAQGRLVIRAEWKRLLQRAGIGDARLSDLRSSSLRRRSEK